LNQAFQNKYRNWVRLLAINTCHSVNVEKYLNFKTGVILRAMEETLMQKPGLDLGPLHYYVISEGNEII